jgi:UDP:flavonoid glycosyltransferase YjiC (YdhE family)
MTTILVELNSLDQSIPAVMFIYSLDQEKDLAEQKAQEKRESKLKASIEEAQLMDQARRNAARAQQEMAEAMAYHKHYGKYGSKMANWRRESDRIHNQ